MNDCSVNGQTYNDEMAIQYSPLHGCIRNGFNYVFGATDIASAFSQRGNEQSWKNLGIDASKNSILFWGWNFEDSGPIEAMYGGDNNIENNTKRWVLLKNPSDEMLDYIISLKFNVIIGDTKDMLEYISEFVKSLEAENSSLSINEKAIQLLKPYEIPQNNDKLASYPLKSYFLEYTPMWSHIYSRVIPKTINYKKIEDSIASGINTIVFGIRCSGKTTLMMQLLIDYDTNMSKHMMVSPSVDQVKAYLKILNGQNSLLFIDDCFRDTNALIALFNTKNVQIVCFDRDFNYERQYHKIQSFQFNPIDVTKIIKEDAQSIVDIIPIELKRENSGTKQFEKDPTILNLLAKTLKSFNFQFMTQFYLQDSDAAKAFLMIAYVHACGVPCSFDMMYSFLGDDKYTWNEMYELIDRVGGLLQDASGWSKTYSTLDTIQDYYQCRSRFLAEKMITSIPQGSRLFAEVLNEFTKYVPVYKICLYDKFRRSAYDADFAIRAFPNIADGIAFYKLCETKDTSEYLYQQAAIYFARQQDCKNAFDWIERARNITHYNRFSIDSTYAKIYFDVNLHADQEQTKKALDILSDCCRNDKRKSIHFATYAKCCLAYYREYGDEEVISSALIYIEEGLDDKNLSLSRSNKYELRDLKAELNMCLE